MGESFNHYAPYASARLAIRVPGGTRITGTGFFYQIRIQFEGVDRYVLVLISNKHLLELGHQGTISLNLTRRKADRKPDHGNVLVYHVSQFAQRYTPHSDPEVDLGCINVSDILGSTDLHFMHIGEEYLTPIDHNMVAPGSEVLFVGYPNDYYDRHNNLPLVRRGTLASLPHIDFNGKGQLIIDAQVFGGSSGSPVFVASGSKYRLLGVIQGTTEGRTPSGTPAVLGLGTVIKQRHVRELVDLIADRIRLMLAANPPSTQSHPAS